MQLNATTRQRRYPSLTSLIDIIFLLLLFFMLSSTFSKYSEVEISSSVSGSGSTGQPPKLFIQLVEDGWKINGELVLDSEIDKFLSAFQNEEAKAILRVTENVNAQRLVDSL
ncbi:MAG: biopolymer transporter ExbD, partial [Pseudomonadota bacterium]